MYAKVKTIGLSVLRGEVVDAEIDVGKGLPDFEIVGLGDTSVKESRKRVRTAIVNTKIQFPVGKITVNLAPADLRKEGSGFDLAIAVGILICAGQIPEHRTEGFALIGELSLDGRVRGVKGMLPMLTEGRKKGIEKYLISKDDLEEAKLSEKCSVYAVETLEDVINFFKHGDISNVICFENTDARRGGRYVKSEKIFEEDMADIAGQKKAKRVLEIAAAGGHNILLKGSPGCGKTMLAKRTAGILPPMTADEAIEVTTIYSAAGLLEAGQGLITDRPMRQVGRGITQAALIGGGANLKVGEISLAHNGILFIDEFAEIGRTMGGLLRQPLEEKQVTFLSQGKKTTLPADFMLVAASNPCKCGYLYEEGRCRCTPYQIRSYEKGISGPLADRIDIHLEVVSVPYGEIEGEKHETSSVIRERVKKVREIQRERYKKEGIKVNASLSGGALKKYCRQDEGSKHFLAAVMDSAGFSMRSYEKILKISRTIADMAGREQICEEDIAEAVRYRPKNATEKD
ncbi:MAG: YifB family Mg chelatase-like AAA ATPase [Clostridia bacterium]|nr:YifB family Mg chelatase-like AAA ATPase [Clostridia bacterium]